VKKQKRRAIFRVFGQRDKAGAGERMPALDPGHCYDNKNMIKRGDDEIKSRPQGGSRCRLRGEGGGVAPVSPADISTEHVGL